MMRIAYLHALPLEYYPPAQNALSLLAIRSDRRIRAWSSNNRRGLPPWQNPAIEITRLPSANPEGILPMRVAGYLAWHLRAAAQIARWRADAIMSVEPHSALAAWIYFEIFRGKAELMVHHHEYYAPEDFRRPGMRVLKATSALERENLFARARWISQTNPERMRLLREWNPRVREEIARVLPNYPPPEWIRRAQAFERTAAPGRLRLVYVGSASFGDTFIREAALWAARHPESVSLHLIGNNVEPDVWSWLRSLDASNITFDSAGCDYNDLPDLLPGFDVGLVLYKGNTLNFIHNVPNKAIEYLACGLEVWYPREMSGMQRFHAEFPAERLRRVDFRQLPSTPPAVACPLQPRAEFPFTCERGMAPLLAALDEIGKGR